MVVDGRIITRRKLADFGYSQQPGRLALVGAALLAIFVLVRGISFDLLDLRVDLAGVKLHEVIEAAGIALVAWSAAIFQRSS